MNNNTNFDRTAGMQPPQEQDNKNMMDMVLEGYTLYVRPYLWVDILVVVLFLIAGVIYLKTVVPKYRSTCRLHINSNEMKVTSAQGIEDPIIQQGETFINTQILMMQSNDLRSKAKKLAGIKGGYEAPVIRRVPGTMLVDLSVASSDADVAAKMANTIAEVYLDSVHNRKIEITYTGMNLLRDQLEEVRKAREEAMTELLNFKKEHQIFNLDDNYNAIVSQINSLNTIATDAKLEETELETTLNSIKENRENAVRLMPYLVPMGSDAGANLSSLKMLYFNHATTLPGLLLQYNEAHTAVKTHREVSKMLLEAQEDEVNTSVDGLQLRYKRSQNRRILVDKQIEDLRKQLADLDRISGDYRLRETTCKSLDSTFTMLVNRINEIKVSTSTTSTDTSAIFLVTPAYKAHKPYFPKMENILGMALMLGIAAAAGLSYILGSVNNKVTNMGEITAAFGNQVPSFGAVPLFDSKEEELLRSTGEENIDEVFRNIRTSLNLSMTTRGSKILAMSSALPRDGKTFIAVNLARSFARDKKRTLLMGMDLRKPRMDRMLEPFLPKGSTRQGISNVLIGDCKLDDVIIPIKDFGIDVALSGPVPPNPNELLSSGGLKELLDEVQSKYDLVIIDTPPIMLVSDTLIITSHNIPLLLTTRLYNVTRPVIRSLVERLAQVNIKPAGLIANNVNVPKNVYNYYSGDYGYGYGEKYGYDKEKK